MTTYEDGETIEYEVCWFPIDSPDRTLLTEDEGRARRKYELEIDRGSNPILSIRTIVITSQIIENSVDRRESP